MLANNNTHNIIIIVLVYSDNSRVMSVLKQIYGVPYKYRTALQILYKATEHARMYNFYVGGLSHTWMPHYISKLTDNGTILNEW